MNNLFLIQYIYLHLKYFSVKNTIDDILKSNAQLFQLFAQVQKSVN